MKTVTNEYRSLLERYYDPATDQFLSVDPDVAKTGQPYAFTGDDPVNATDPLGQYVTGGGSSECNSSGGTTSCTGSTSSGQSVAGSYDPSTYATTGAFVGAPITPPEGTNYDFAAQVLQDGHWPTSANNITTLVDWFTSEGPASHWWTGGNPVLTHVNPLNTGQCSGGGDGTGNIPGGLISAASCIVQTLQYLDDGYQQITSDFQQSVNPQLAAPAIFNSRWSLGRYANPILSPNVPGSAWHYGYVPVVIAPSNLWNNG